MKWARLQSGESGKKKPGPKGKMIKDSSKFDAFSKAQIKGLVAMGIVDEDDQTTEIKRRWDAMNKAQGKTPLSKTVSASAPKTSSEIRLDQPLDDSQLKSTGLTFVKSDTVGSKVIFIYKPSGDAVAKKKVNFAETSAASSAKAKSAAIKRKKVEEEEDDDDDDDDEDDLDWACEISKERLLK
eukprot:3039039-Prymnesium_polylepis.1